jgi:hypothetical protein
VVYLDGERLKRVKDFVYLGRLFLENGNFDGEIDRRVSAGKKVVGSWTGLTCIVYVQRFYIQV